MYETANSVLGNRFIIDYILTNELFSKNLRLTTKIFFVQNSLLMPPNEKAKFKVILTNNFFYIGVLVEYLAALDKHGSFWLLYKK